MRRLLLALAVVLVLAVALDRVAVVLAEREIERRASADVGVTVGAQVHGFPFLTQLARRRLKHVTLRGGLLGVAGGFTVSELHADLRDVDVSDPAVPVAGAMQIDGVLPFELVEDRLRLPAGSLRPAGPDAVRVTRSVEVGRRTVSASGVARVRVEGGNILVVAPEQVTVAGSRVRGRVADAVVVRYVVRGLPPTTRLQVLGVTAEGFRVRVEGNGVRLS